LARISNLRRHLSCLVNAYDNGDNECIAMIVEDARETLGRKAGAPAPTVPNEIIIGDENDAYVDLGNAAFVRFDAADIDLIKDRVWTLSKDGYAVNMRFGAGSISMHVLIFGRQQGKMIDHVDGNKLDNRRQNLRFATASENQFNRGMSSNNTSGYKGVTFVKKENKWRARITAYGKTIHLGDFSDRHEAGYAYEKAAKEHHGEFACTY